jgi:hypothetical protein
MKTKIIGILVSMLLIATALHAVGTMNDKKDETEHIEPQLISSSIVWSDDFDSYAAGTTLHGQGGWEAWDLNPQWSPYVMDNQSRSGPNSVELDYHTHTRYSDIVRIFYGVNSGQWTVTAWSFLPEEFEGCSAFVLHNKYEHNGNHQFPRDCSVPLIAESSTNKIKDNLGGGELPIIKNEWIEIRIEIDFDSDTYDIYYNNTYLGSGSWTHGDGQLNLACIDLCNDPKYSNETYFDDITLEGDVSVNADLYCEGDITLTDVEPGTTVVDSFIVQNSGADGTLLDWEIESTPDWGEWSFDPNGGVDLESWSPITIDVEIVAPEEANTEFTGEIKIINSEDPDDYCIIDVSLSTPNIHESDGLFGWVFLHGWIFNPREQGTKISARAINLHYLELTPMGVYKGVVRLKKVSFKNGLFIKRTEKGLLGKTVRVTGFCHGGIEIL